VEPIRAAVDGLWHAVESFKESGAAQGTEDFYRRWLDIAGDEFEVPGGAMLSVPMNEEWLTACAMAPDLIAEYLDAQVEMGRLQMEVQASVGIRVSWGGGDLADKNGPIYGPRFFREIVMPRYQRLGEHAHKVGMKYLFRSDGYLIPILDDLFDGTTMDGFGEIDYDAGVRIPDLLARYPSLTCWGNVSCALLRNGTPQQIRAATEEIVAAGQAHGRLILGSSNTVLPGTPPENYFTMWGVVQ
jgi:uroporphyrinogen-III decarboxylase